MVPARPASRDVEQGADRPSDIDADELRMVLHVGSIVQIARARLAGLRVLMLAAAGAPTDQPPAAGTATVGWFEMENTEVPSRTSSPSSRRPRGQRRAVGFGPAGVLGRGQEPARGRALPPRPARDAKTRDEYNRAFMLTLNRSNFRIYSIDRVQNVSLWHRT